MTLNNSTPNAPDNNGFFTQLEAFLQAFRANSTAQTTANGLFGQSTTAQGTNGLGQQAPAVSQNTTAAATRRCATASSRSRGRQDCHVT